MADATKAGPSIQSLIDKGLNARLKKLNLTSAKKKVSDDRTFIGHPGTHYPHLDVVWPGRKEEEGPASQSIDFQSKAKATAHQGEQKACREEEGEREEQSQEGQRQRKGKSKVDTKTCINLSNPTTLPDEVLDMSMKDAIQLVHLHIPLNILEAGLYRNSVHMSDGVSIPLEISNDLSLGIKYMFFSPPSKNLILESWKEFQDRLRWRIFFSFKDGVNKPYDPDYGVTSNKEKEAPKLPLWMELGLVMGRRFVNKTIASIPAEKLEEIRKNPFSPKSPKILKFLKDNNYVVTMTDKNLGLAVSERDWLISNELKLLVDKRNYKELSKIEADKIMLRKEELMIELADMVDDHIFLHELNLQRYFKSKLTRTGEEIQYPQFHGIPKIHKKPTGFRPIVPCHSVSFNPAAKFVSKELKPIVREAPSIIHGTKDLFTRLSQLSIEPRRKFFFVTGDVTAYYPNIPLKSCINIITSMYEEWLFSNSDTDTDILNPNSLKNNEVKLKIFKSAIEIGNTQLISQHGQRFFEQLGGLAMGVADSPDLANLYGYHFEKLSGIIDHVKVIFYGRYIDDCISLVYAETADEALNFISNMIKFDGCEIVWAVSDIGCQFLDAYLFKKNNKLEWRPYVKAGNNRERIPWVSHHPIDVKRGVYIGELSRLSVICSNKEIYIEAIRDLNTLYCIRGYPEKLVISWCKKNMQERWDARFNKRANQTADEGVLVLKTRFDDVWNWFSATELGKTITEYWEEWYTRAEQGRYLNDPSRPFPKPDEDNRLLLNDVRPDLFTRVQVDGEEEMVPDLRKIGVLGRRWIVSRKRTTNLFDLTNQWKKIVFRKLDEDIAEEGGVVPEVSDYAEDILLTAAKNTAPEPLEEEEILLHQRERSQELEHPTFGRSSKIYN